MADLAAFLRSGQLGDLRLGMSTCDVEAAWGEAPGRSTSGTVILEYGPVELSFADDRLVLMAVYFRRSREWPRFVRPDPMSARRSWSALRSWLMSNGLEWSPITELTFDDQAAWRVRSSGVVVMSEGDELDSLQLAA